jgi:hypothetical protein
MDYAIISKCSLSPLRCAERAATATSALQALTHLLNNVVLVQRQGGLA